MSGGRRHPPRAFGKRPLAAFAAGLLLSLCGPACRQPERPSSIRIGLHSGPVTLDPHAHNEVGTFSILRNVYDTLVVFDDQLQLQPLLADSWSNPDDTTWRFHLRSDAHFWNQTPVTSDHVVFSLERAMTRPDSLLASYLVEIETVTAAGPQEVIVKTRRPFPALLNKLAFIAILEEDLSAKTGSAAGSGPYRIESWRKGEPFSLEPVPGNWGSRKALHRLLVVPSGDPAERTEKLLRGELDIVQDIQPVDVERVNQHPELKVVSVVSTVIEYLHLSASDPRFKDPRVREAIDLALDRQLLVREVTKGHGQVASQLVSPGVFGYDPSLGVPKRDLARARALLSGAGYRGGFALTLEYRHGRSGEEIARQLGELGIQVTLRSSSFAEIFPRLVRGEIPFYLGGVTAPTVDASDIFDSFAHTRTGVYGRSNFNGYSNPILDELTQRVASERDMTARRKLLQETMRILVADRYHLPLLGRHDLYGIRKDIEWQPHLDRALSGWEMRWK
ncbi:MAG: ABC transporter substrate-binding protein [Thermoanaerobaculia bacterium]|nr:ABC transporter substrate-binding protein [Thermoanaerobaculia bacterium]